mgnify:FL=1
MNKKLLVIAAIFCIVCCFVLAACSDRETNVPDKPNKKIFTVTIEKNIEEAGSISVTESEIYDGEEVTVTAATNAGYTFIGWYDGETRLTYELSYTFEMPNTNVTYTAKWYKFNLKCNDTEAGSVGGLTNAYKVGYSATVTANTNAGYTFVGWYDGEKELTDKLFYTFKMPSESATYTAKWIKCPVTLEKNIEEAGTVHGVEGATEMGKKVTITATANAGYAFLGWYDGETELTKELTYTFYISNESKSYTAKFGYAFGTVTVINNINGGKVTIKGLGWEVTLTAETYAGYIFVGWYDGDTKISEGLSYTLEITLKKKTYTAKFEKCTEHELDDKCICTKCGAVSHTVNADCECTKCRITIHGQREKGYCRHDDVIYFGSYPQTRVTDDDITDALNHMAGELPTSDNSANWTSYGYYKYGSESNYTWYIDGEYNGEKYRGVYFTSYRPYYTTGNGSTDYSYQDDNGYYIYTVYWFRYEPIKWNILKESSGKALILADLALDSQQYYRSDDKEIQTRNGRTVYANDYAESDIRKWLNDTFYNTAFNDVQKALIAITLIDNVTTGYDTTNQYNGNQINTDDKIFLPSYKDVFKTNAYFKRNADRQKKSTDYAKSQGCYASTDSRHKGNCYWWLRSPYYKFSYLAYYVYYFGELDNSGVSRTLCGVVPAVYIKLS